jgi:hypothetical protein
MSKQERISRSARKARAMLGQQVKELAGHVLEVSRYGAHGHALGRQGRTGHPMPKSNLTLQSGARLPQNIEGEGCAADDASTRNYGIVDTGQKDAVLIV